MAVALPSSCWDLASPFLVELEPASVPRALHEDLMPVGQYLWEYQNPKDLTFACQEAAFRSTLTPPSMDMGQASLP